MTLEIQEPKGSCYLLVSNGIKEKLLLFNKYINMIFEIKKNEGI